MKQETRCRICKAKLPANSSSPFCSERCKMNDLSKWFGENYRIASTSQDEHKPTSHEETHTEDHD